MSPGELGYGLRDLYKTYLQVRFTTALSVPRFQL